MWTVETICGLKYCTLPLQQEIKAKHKTIEKLIGKHQQSHWNAALQLVQANEIHIHTKSKQTDWKYPDVHASLSFTSTDWTIWNCVWVCARCAHIFALSRKFGKSLTNFCHIYFNCMPCICVNTRNDYNYLQSLTIGRLVDALYNAQFDYCFDFHSNFILHSTVSIYYCSPLVSGLRVDVCWKDDGQKNEFNEWWPNITDNLLSPVNSNENVRVIEFQPHSH